jgi:Na+/H+ antiporter 1.
MIIHPIEHFLHVQTTNELLLLTTTVIALVWTNSNYSSSYEHL